MENPEFVFAAVGFFVAIVVEWGTLWYVFGRHKDGRSQRRYRIWNTAGFAVTVLVFWPLAFGRSWETVWIVGGMVSLCVLAALIQKAQMTVCPACKELLRNPEWPSPLPRCYKCGEKLPQPQEERTVGADPSQQ